MLLILILINAINNVSNTYIIVNPNPNLNA